VQVCVVIGSAVELDLDLVRQIMATECAALGVPGRLVSADGGLEAALERASDGGPCAVVAVPGPAPSGVVTFDPGADRAQGPADQAAVLGSADQGRAQGSGDRGGAEGSGDHIYGRGLWGLAWAIRRAVYQLRVPPRRVVYGPDPDQWAEVRLPVGSPGPGGWPVAVLIHGGYWRSMWGADLMDALAIDLADRGIVAWNLEYRRPDRHVWAVTVADVALGVEKLRSAAEGGQMALDRIAVIGHSAGAQLALQLAADLAHLRVSAGQSAHSPRIPHQAVEGAFVPEDAPLDAASIASGALGAQPAVRVGLAVSLAGVIDLVEGARRGLSNAAVVGALGGSVAQRPAVYAHADPVARLPIGVPLLVVQGRQDDLDLIDISRRFVGAARTAGDEVSYIERAGDHFAVIDPTSELWRETAEHLVSVLSPAGVPTSVPGDPVGAPTRGVDLT
jgi:acetyl esterase/lipase